MDFFRDKAVLITGASSGIGRATALRLARGGAKITLAARNLEALKQVQTEIQDSGGSALVAQTDVTESEQVRQAVDTTVSAFGKLDILIACAGLSMPMPDFEGSQLDALRGRVMRVNFFGVMYATHFALPHVKKTQGSLVALSSLTGKRGIPSYAMYGASKFAIQGLWRCRSRPGGGARRRACGRGVAGLCRYAPGKTTSWGRTAKCGTFSPRRRHFTSGLRGKNASIASCNLIIKRRREKAPCSPWPPARS